MKDQMSRAVQAIDPAVSKNSSRNWIPIRPFLIAAALYAAVTIAILIASVRAADGHFIYALDDTYISMAMAKNFSAHGVWGITRYEFGSASSAPFFVLVLSSVYLLIGPNQYVALLLSWIFGLASIGVAARILAAYLTRFWQTVALCVMVLLTPLFVVGTLGMEHSLHLLLVLLFLWQFDKEKESPWIIALITALMVGTRYEGLFMAVVGCLLLIAKRQWMKAAIVAAAAWLPVCCYALYSFAHGGYWLPCSVALKGMHGFHLGFGARMVHQFWVALLNSIRGPHLFFLLAVIVLAMVALRKSQPHLARLLALLAGAGYLHLLMADIGWAYRYEDYLIAPAILLVACSLPSLKSASKSHAIVYVVSLSLCATAFLMARSLQAAVSLPKYSRAIYLQQWQMTRFVSTYYPHGSIAANDIGAVNFKNDLRCLDLVGLASSDVFYAKRAGTYSTQFLERETSQRGTSIAILYDSLFTANPQSYSDGPPLPNSWIRVGRWKVDQKQQLGGDTVSFYALTPDEAQRLKGNLERFNPTLPSGATPLP